MSDSRRIPLKILTLAVVLLLPAWLSATDCEAGSGPLRPAKPDGVDPQEIVRLAIASESATQAAMRQFTYKQDVVVQTLAADAKTPKLQVDGEFRMVAEIGYHDGRRLEHVAFAPQSTLRRIALTTQDMEDIRRDFAFEPEMLSDCRFLYAGRQRVDELETYVFDVAPNSVEKKHRYFQGRIWVEQRDLQVVKTCGQMVPSTPVKKKGKKEENLFPKFVSYREQIDGHNWFPTYIRSDDTLKFKTGDVHVRQIIRYSNFQPSGETSGLRVREVSAPKK